MRRRKGLRAQQRDWNYITAEMQRAAQQRRPRCGCPRNAPEADPSRYPCPCGAHCAHGCQPGGTMPTTPYTLKIHTPDDTFAIPWDSLLPEESRYKTIDIVARSYHHHPALLAAGIEATAELWQGTKQLYAIAYTVTVTEREAD